MVTEIVEIFVAWLQFHQIAFLEPAKWSAFIELFEQAFMNKMSEVSDLF